MKRKIFIILSAICIVILTYKLYPKSGSFKDLVVNEYTNTEFGYIEVNGEWCGDKEKINEVLSYLEKFQLVEYRGRVPYEGEKIYLIGLYSNNNGNMLGISTENKNFIMAYIKNGEEYSTTKQYKIIDDSLDMKYIEELYHYCKKTEKL